MLRRAVPSTCRDVIPSSLTQILRTLQPIHPPKLRLLSLRLRSPASFGRGFVARERRACFKLLPTLLQLQPAEERLPVTGAVPHLAAASGQIRSSSNLEESGDEMHKPISAAKSGPLRTTFAERAASFSAYYSNV
jgi:hypothetical protein